MRLKLDRKRPCWRSEEGQVVAKLGTIQRPSVQWEGGRKSGSPGEFPPKAGGGEDKDYSAKDMRKEQFPRYAESQKKTKYRSKQSKNLTDWLHVLEATGRPR